jgi:ubiquinone/menaquinone biosynthesis C-methylase UbiE
MDYVAKTIEAYDKSPDKYGSATLDMANLPEMEIMGTYLPSAELPILDVGCANGRDTKILHDMGYKTVGIDMSREFLKQAQQSHPELDFRYMDVRKLDFEDASFGAVWCSAVLLHLNQADLAKALQEIKRVLVARGVVALSFKKGEGEKEVLETFSSELARYYNFQTQNSLNALLANAGFVVRRSHDINEQERFGPHKRNLDWVWSFATKP